MGTSPSFDLDDGPPTLDAPPLRVRVFKYKPDAEKDEPLFTWLPNVYCHQVAEHEGSEPATARFSYMLDNTLHRDAGWPCEFEDLWPMQAPQSKLRVKQDDRLVVVAWIGEHDRDRRLLFDGFVTAPQADVGPDQQEVTFAASSVAVRCWDEPVGGRWQRDGDAPENGEVVHTGLPTRFNPDAKQNCTPDDHDDESIDDFPHPVFIETRGDDASQSAWTLAKAARYLLARYNDEEYVDNPDFAVLDDLLNSRRPKDGGPFYDPNDAATYDESPITLSDYDCDNRPWPEVLGELLGYYGFGMRFVAELDDKGLPWHQLELYRRDQTGPTEPKDLRLPKTGAALDPNLVDLGGFAVSHDFRGVANEIEVETRPKLYEVAVVLAPGFKPQAGDEQFAARKAFLKSESADATTDAREKYRLYVADELGTGHWSLKDAAWAASTPIDLKGVFPDVDDPGHFGVDGKLKKITGYVRRYRPGERNLVTKDAKDKPMRAALHVSRDYAGPDPPCVWDGTGHWQAVTSWELLDDRLGVNLTAEDLAQWNIGEHKGANPQVMSKKLNGIAPLSVPGDTDQTKPFFLRLTTVIEGDHGIDVVAEKRKASPIGFTIKKRVDARDHYKWRAVHKSSPHFDGLELDESDDVLKDDTDAAREKAVQLRAAHEFPPIAGAVTIPRLDFALSIGDRIKSINGRAVSLQVNAGSEAGEAKSYPFVVARTWNMAGEQQSTSLQLSDRRAEPPPIGARR